MLNDEIRRKKLSLKLKKKSSKKLRTKMKKALSFYYSLLE
jgi:hypothetical protein